MQIVRSFEDLQQQVAEIRSLRLGFITNFYPDPEKNGLWIEKCDLKNYFTYKNNYSI